MTNQIELQTIQPSIAALPVTGITAPRAARTGDSIAAAKGAAAKAARTTEIALEAPKGAPANNEQAEGFYQLLGQLGILYKMQEKNYETTMGVLNSESSQLRQMQKIAKMYSDKMLGLAKQEATEMKKQKQMDKDKIWEDIGIAALGVLIAVGTGGVAAGAVAVVIGALMIGMSDFKNKKGENGFDLLMSKAIDPAINDALKASGLPKMTPETQRWFNFGFKIGIAITLGLIGGGIVSAAADSAEAAGVETAEEAGEATASGTADAAATAGEESTEEAGEATVSATEDNAESTASTDRGLVKTLKGARDVLRKVAKNRHVKGGATGVTTAIETLDKFTSVEGTKGKIAERQENAVQDLVRGVNGNPMTAKGMEKADLKGKGLTEALDWILAATAIAANLPGMFGGAAFTESSAAMKAFTVVQMLGNVAQGVGMGVKQSIEADVEFKQAAIARKKAQILPKQTKLNGAMQMADMVQKEFSQEAVKLASVDAARTQLIMGALRAMDEAVVSELRG